MVAQKGGHEARPCLWIPCACRMSPGLYRTGRPGKHHEKLSIPRSTVRAAEWGDTLKVPVYNVGDSRKVHNIMYAIWDAYEIAREM